MTHVEDTLPYVLGHAPPELQRLMFQSESFRPQTEQLFRLAGLTSGMRVLDIGSGAGDVSLLAAEFAGPSGEVVGIDRSSDAVAFANARARAAGVANVSFQTGDLANPQIDGEFDAIVGRLILLYLPDPSSTVRRLVASLRPGGVAAFHEMIMTGLRWAPEDLPLFASARRWLIETFSRAGVDPDLGMRLPQIFTAAGLPLPQLIVGTNASAGTQTEGPELFAQTVWSLLPMSERLGVARADEVQPETLGARLSAQLASRNGVLIAPLLMGAWATK
jgi:SAM-dependent methyltransferase